MVLGEPIEQAEYSTAAHVIGWIYHFSNGATFGVMYLAIVGDGRRHWIWAVLFALGLELGMLFTPYPGRLRHPVDHALCLCDGSRPRRVRHQPGALRAPAGEA